MNSKKVLITLISLIGSVSIIAGLFFTFNKKEYQVTFNLNNGEKNVVVKVKSGSKVTQISNPEKYGYAFVEWRLEGEIYDFDNKIENNIVLDAIWKKEEVVNDKNVYTVTFDTDGGSNIASELVKENRKVDIPDNPKKDGYTFVEWQLNGKKYDFNSEVVSDITLKAVWKEKKYIVKFDIDGGSSINDIEVKENSKVTKPSDPKKDGYTFVEWQLDGKTYDFNSEVVKDITLKAVWKKIEENNNPTETPEVKKYTVKFDTDGGNSVSSQTVVEGNKASKPVNPKKDGHTFVEWQLDGKKYDFNTKINKDITLKAVWKKNQTEEVKKYTVTFDSNGGSSVASQTITEGNTATKPSNPTRSGYTFVEWQLNGSSYNFSTKVTSNITLKAVWQAKTYTVSVSRVDNYSPDSYLTIYENGKAIMVKEIAYTDGTKIICSMNENKIIVSTSDIEGESKLLVTLSDGNKVTATIN